MSEELYLHAGERIKALRIRIGLTREQLAELADISSKHLYEIEIKGKGFSSKTLVSLAGALNASCDYLLLGKVNNTLEEVPDEMQGKISALMEIVYDLAIK